jgi:hypothetical protein
MSELNNNVLAATQRNIEGIGKSGEKNMMKDAFAVTARSVLTNPRVVGDVHMRHSLQQKYGSSSGGQYGIQTVDGVDIHQLRQAKKAVGQGASFSANAGAPGMASIPTSCTPFGGDSLSRVIWATFPMQGW